MPGEDETNDLQVQEDKREETDASVEDRNPEKNFRVPEAVNIIDWMFIALDWNKQTGLAGKHQIIGSFI